MPGGRALTLVTWNVQGRAGLDVDAAGQLLRQVDPDVVALQEVQRGQARALAARLGPEWAWTWGFKHWPLVSRPEGAAVLSRHPLTARRVHVLRPALPLTSTRRIAVLADCDVGGRRLRVASVHLSPAAADGAWRRRELAQVAAARPDLVLGDLNEPHLEPLLPVLEAHGWADCWDPAHGAGCTHWGAAGGPRHEREPDHRLDYVLTAPHLTRVSARVPSGDELAPLSALSDHLPLVVEVDLP